MHLARPHIRVWLSPSTTYVMPVNMTQPLPGFCVYSCGPKSIRKLRAEMNDQMNASVFCMREGIRAVDKINYVHGGVLGWRAHSPCTSIRDMASSIHSTTSTPLEEEKDQYTSSRPASHSRMHAVIVEESVHFGTVRCC